MTHLLIDEDGVVLMLGTRAEMTREALALVSVARVRVVEATRFSDHIDRADYPQEGSR